MDIIKLSNQQGDVLIGKIDSIPKKVEKLGKGSVVLAEGEATGHAHVATADDIEIFKGSDGILYMSAPNGTQVVHEEHGMQTVVPGNYKIWKVREFDHFEEEAREVID